MYTSDSSEPSSVKRLKYYNNKIRKGVHTIEQINKQVNFVSKYILNDISFYNKCTIIVTVVV